MKTTINTMTPRRISFACSMAAIADFGDLLDVCECINTRFGTDYAMPEDAEHWDYCSCPSEARDIAEKLDDTGALFEDVLSMCPKGSHVWKVVKDFLDSLPAEIEAIEEMAVEWEADCRAIQWDDEHLPRWW